MRKKNLSVIVATLAIVLSLIGTALAQTESYTCETCPMTVGPDALDHLKVTDASGVRHYVECMGCALKLLKTSETIHIETYCDWYGPEYKITADISQHGAVTTVNPESALLLVGGGCTGNRVAYNQTAADALLANGFSEYTMMMMKQPLPDNTNVTTVSKKALTFAAAETTTEPPQSPFVPIALGIVAAAVVIAAIVAYKKLKR